MPTLNCKHGNTRIEVRKDYDGEIKFLVKDEELTLFAFAAHVEHAKRLLVGTDHTGADVITLADRLAGGASND